MKNMEQICIDATPLGNHHRFRGFGRYVEGLLSGFERILTHSQYVNFQSLRIGKSTANSLHFFPHRLLPPRAQWPFNCWLLPSFLKKHNVKLFHAIDPGNITKSQDLLTVATGHDLIPWIFKNDYIENSPWDRRRFFNNILKAYQRADHIIAISEATKRDFTTMLNIPSKKISVIYQGYDEKTFIRKTVDPVSLRRFPSRFFLYVGGFDPRKNVFTLLSAFAAIKHRVTEKLILAGKTTANEAKQLTSKIEALNLRSEVFLTDYVEDHTLVDLYNSATAFVFPSRYEGFGLPLLEAMACGCPIISTNSSCIPEIVQDAALLFDPDDVAGLAGAMLDLSQNEFSRLTLQLKGQARLKDFSWEICARNTISLYEELLGSSI